MITTILIAIIYCLFNRFVSKVVNDNINLFSN